MSKFCSIKRDANNNITRVQTKDGSDSVLFHSLVSIPFVFTKEKAAEMYANVFSSKFIQRFGDWTNHIAYNKKGISQIKNKLSGVVNDAVVSRVEFAANSMRNPKIVTLVDKPDGYGNAKGQFFSENLAKGTQYFLYDDIISSQLDVEEGQVPDGGFIVETERELLNMDANPVVYFNSSDGNSYVVIKEAQSITNIETLPETENKNPLIYGTGEPRLFFRDSNGNIHDNYKNALKNTQQGDVEVGFIASLDIVEANNDYGFDSLSNDVVFFNNRIKLNNSDSFITIQRINSDSSQNSKYGVINYLIRKGFLAGSRRFINGNYYLVGSGETIQESNLMSKSAFGELERLLGRGYVKLYAHGGIEYTDKLSRNKVSLRTVAGEDVVVDKDTILAQLNQGRYIELASIYEDFDFTAAALYMERVNIYDSYLTDQDVIANVREEDNQLVVSMLNILRSFGISMHKLSDYVDKYAQKYGRSINAKALAHLSEKVIALAENATAQDLTEEVSHFLLETYENQAELESAFQALEQTEEWAEESGRYYEIYSKNHSGEALERMVHMEIMGKVLGNTIAGRFQNPNPTVFEQLSNFLIGVYNRIRSLLSSNYKNQRADFNSLIDRIADLALNDNHSEFNIDQLTDRDYFMYSVSSLNELDVLNKHIRTLEDRIVSLKRIKGNTQQLRQQVAEIDNQVKRGSVLYAFKNIVAAADAQVSSLANQIDNAKKERESNPNKPVWNYLRRNNLSSMERLIRPMLTEVRSSISASSMMSLADKNNLLASIDAIQGRIPGLEAEAKVIMDAESGDILINLAERWGAPKSAIDWLKKYSNKVHKDVSKISQYFGLLEYSSNEFLTAFGKRISEALFYASRMAQSQTRRFLQMHEDGKWTQARYEGLLQKTPNGYSSYLECPYRFDEYHDNMANETLRIISSMDTIQGAENPFKGLSVEGLKKIRSKKQMLSGIVNTFNGIPNIESFTISERNYFNSQMDIWKRDNEERYFTDEYYQMIDQRYEDAAKIRIAYPELGIDENTPISTESIDFFRNLTRRRAEIKSRFRNADGSTDYVRMYRDVEAIEALNDISRARKMAKSNFDVETGELKKDAAMILAKDIQAVDRLYQLDNLFSRIKALDDINGSTNVYKDNTVAEMRSLFLSGDKTLNSMVFLFDDGDYNLNPDYFSESNKQSLFSARTIPDAFMVQLVEIQRTEGNKAAFEFLRSNGRLSFTDEFWKGSQLDSLLSRVQSLNTPDSWGEASLIEQQEVLSSLGLLEKRPGDPDTLRDLLDKRSEILRSYTEYNNPSEIDYASIPTMIRDNIVELSNRIEAMQMRVSSILRKTDIGERSFMDFENTTNDAYNTALDSSGINELSFIKKNVTVSGLKRIQDFETKINVFKGSRGHLFSIGELEFISHYLNLDDAYKNPVLFYDEVIVSITDSQWNTILVEYGKRNLMPYFKRFAPRGYDVLWRGLNDGIVNPVNLIVDLFSGDHPMSDSLTIDLQNEWYADNSEYDNYRNKNYDTGRKYGLFQPKMSKYRNDNYYDRFGITQDSEGNDVATRNIEDFEMIQELASLRRTALEENYEEQDLLNFNLYMIPQISKGSIERAKKIVSDPRNVIKNSVLDVLQSRVDSPEYGQVETGYGGSAISGERVMPKLYLNKLENPEDVSTDLVYSYQMLIAESAKYKANMDAMGDYMAIENGILSQKFENKDAENTNIYQMYQEAFDAFVNGVRINKKLVYEKNGIQIDFTKMIKGIEKIAYMANLGFSVPIALTAATSAQANLMIERAVGQYFDSDSSNMAYKELPNMFTDFWGDYGKPNRRKKTYVVGELMKIYDIRERSRSAGFSRIIRAMDNIPFKMLEILNSPLGPQVMATILYGYRIYDGKFLNYRLFKEHNSNAGLSKSEIYNKWKSLKDFSLYDVFEVDSSNNVVYEKRKPTDRREEIKYKDSFIEKLGDRDMAIEIIDRTLASAQREVVSLNEKVDGAISQESKSAASRNIFLSSTLGHRGWFFIAMSRRFRKGGFSFQTNQMEIGSYRSLMSFIGMIAKTFIHEKSFNKTANAIKENWNDHFLLDDNGDPVLDENGNKIVVEGLTDIDKINLRRILIDLATLAIAGIVSSLAAGISDDDDNKDAWGLQMASFVAMRTANEMYSQNAPYMLTDMLNILEKPFVPIKNAMEIVTPSNWSTDIIQSGHFKGDSKLFRTLINQTYFRNIYRVRNDESLKRYIDSWRKTSRNTLPWAQKETKAERKRKERENLEQIR